MKLNSPITITPPPYPDPQGKIIQPPSMELTELTISFTDSPSQKTVAAIINGFPRPLVLITPEEYDSVGDYTQAFIDNRLLEKLGNNPAQTLRNLFPKTLEENPNGPGSVLSGMLSTIGIKATPNCSCRQYAIMMNDKGPDWCEQNIDTILDWLRKEAARRNLPFIEAGAKLLVNRAISTSRKLLAKESNVSEPTAN